MDVDCKKKYHIYKRKCQVIYSGISCKLENVKTMSQQELIEHIGKLKKLYNYSLECYNLRKQYKHGCIDASKRDSGHDHAIYLAKQFSLVCKKQIEQVNERFDELAKEFQELQNAQRGLARLVISEKEPNSDFQESSEVSEEPKSKPKKRQENKKKKRKAQDNFSLSDLEELTSQFAITDKKK